MAIIICALVLLSLLELGFAARAPQRQRWPFNFGFGAVNLIILGIAVRIGPAAATGWAGEHSFGVFNQVALSPLVQIILVVTLMDGAIYWQHRAFHRFPFLWRFHRLHHADGDFDVTTGIRFHPVEAVLSLLFKGAMAMLLGAPPEAMLIFEIYLSVGSLTEHANVRLPQGLDRTIRPIWVTPAMHIIHHSAEARDRDQNFSFALSLWDRLFGTYLGKASGPRIGLSN